MLFSEARAVILNKTDLIPYTNFNMDSFTADIVVINPRITIIKTSAISGEGLEEWFRWLRMQIEMFSAA
jgi:hydrogenase nickel incorporation protein HypB